LLSPRILKTELTCPIPPFQPGLSLPHCKASNKTNIVYHMASNHGEGGEAKHTELLAIGGFSHICTSYYIINLDAQYRNQPGVERPGDSLFSLTFDEKTPLRRSYLISIPSRNPMLTMSYAPFKRLDSEIRITKDQCYSTFPLTRLA